LPNEFQPVVVVSGQPKAWPAPRVPLIDVLRGFAIVQMIAYHFIYDLDLFGFIHVRMLEDQPWLGWRAAIVTQFLLLAGASLSLRVASKPASRDFWKRWLQVALAAGLVSLGTRIEFGPRFIWFGILHFIAIALILVRPMARFTVLNLSLGIVALAAGLLYASASFDAEPLNAIGFASHKPYNVDYVPLFPWIGVVLIGAGLGALWVRRHYPVPVWAVPLNQPLQPLHWLGNWSLTVYLLHQPVLMALLLAVRAALRS
jgi:uncharacterized membrane protein